MIATVSDSGWINENLFCDWLRHFISFAKPSKEAPVLLILDNHESHNSLDSFMICRDNGINLISLPPHTSHKMQPLDLTFFGPLKNAYNRECELYMAECPGRKITQYEVVELFTKAFNRVSNLEKARNGFKAAGIHPIDPHKFDEFFSMSSRSSNPSTLTNPPDTMTLTNLTDSPAHINLPDAGTQR
ncbi:pogo transposable element with krab domain-like protein [Lasius niger]|uniref:Pogo transposable element with krab domain-like protein n=1 Tax=Lasius niger TaxID=67767 RepID=A0A0J7K7H7_LASNI|nr:pogo transposable element with krab domain-like protein [Lasius niger]